MRGDPRWIALGLGVAVLAGCAGDGGERYADAMAREHAGDRPVTSGAAGGETAIAIDEQEVVYAEIDGVPISGVLARPAERPAELPGIIVIQEWWGLNDNIRQMTRKLAGLGYTALAVDLYRGQVAADPDEARRLMSEANQRGAESEQNLAQAREYLARQGATRVGVIGWCFGGGWSLRAALAMPDRLDAAVIYYGQLVTDAERLAGLETPVLGIFGAEDGGIPLDTVREFERVLAELGKPASIHVYPGADHAFANPSGTRYDAEAAADAWDETVAFFARQLKSAE
ncbi:MAG TPA: dienelactone hydrolase family protein [Candidatus Polarisedimenticolaceae bacterium]|nr:dienelactone hydrolase family protein [Candidatus Polarisedimenticolaceae bacterium]